MPNSMIDNCVWVAFYPHGEGMAAIYAQLRRRILGLEYTHIDPWVETRRKQGEIWTVPISHIKLAEPFGRGRNNVRRYIDRLIDAKFISAHGTRGALSYRLGGVIDGVPHYHAETFAALNAAEALADLNDEHSLVREHSAARTQALRVAMRQALEGWVQDLTPVTDEHLIQLVRSAP